MLNPYGNLETVGDFTRAIDDLFDEYIKHDFDTTGHHAQMDSIGLLQEQIKLKCQQEDINILFAYARKKGEDMIKANLIKGLKTFLPREDED
jgi:hypothetical protein